MKCERNNVPVERVIRHASYGMKIFDPGQGGIKTHAVVADLPCRECGKRKCSLFVLGGDNEWHGISDRQARNIFPEAFDSEEATDARFISNARF